MPRYFFNLVDDMRVQDPEGTDLANLESAKGEARKDIADVKAARFDTLDGDWSHWTVEVCDHKGKLLLVVPFMIN